MVSVLLRWWHVVAIVEVLGSWHMCDLPIAVDRARGRCVRTSLSFLRQLGKGDRHLHAVNCFFLALRS